MDQQKKDHLTKDAGKYEVLSELTTRCFTVIDAYINQKPIYKPIHELRDVLDVLLIRCK